MNSVHYRAPFSVRLSLALLGIVLLGAAASGFSSRPDPALAREPIAVKIRTCRDGADTHFYVQNSEACEITMTFEMSLLNLQAGMEFPHTATFPPGQETEAFTLSPIEPGAQWEYSYTNYFKLGSQCARHDDSCVYQLPYAPGHEFKVTQGYNGTFSHKGSNKYAIDWKMPEGTPVRAARAGLVAKIKDSSDTGGSSLKYDKYNNYVLIRHEDGTLGHYCHLQKNSSFVKVGQKVSAGDLLARSGNTGFSSGPHLHFCVFKALNGRERESIPVRFKTADKNAVTLLEGHRYKTPETQRASSQPASGPLVVR